MTRSAVFDLVDRDGGGTVTKEELGELVREYTVRSLLFCDWQ